RADSVAVHPRGDPRSSPAALRPWVGPDVAYEKAPGVPGLCGVPGRTRDAKLVGVAGFEPTTTCPPDKCATRLRYTPVGWRLYATRRTRGLKPYPDPGGGRLQRLSSARISSSSMRTWRTIWLLIADSC